MLNFLISGVGIIAGVVCTVALITLCFINPGAMLVFAVMVAGAWWLAGITGPKTHDPDQEGGPK